VPELAPRLLLCHAAPIEGAIISGEHPGFVSLLGVGKVAAAISLTRLLERAQHSGRPPDGVLLFGICGVYPARHGGSAPLSIGSLCVVEEDLLADEGVTTREGFLDLEGLGLGSIGPFVASDELTSLLVRDLEERGESAPRVRGNTVSSCSGVDARSEEMAARTGAAIETMEGAAVAQVCQRFGIPLVQLRSVSNETGDRDEDAWDVPGASERVQVAILEGLRSGLFAAWERG
jgi:futalosine hydrolase